MKSVKLQPTLNILLAEDDEDDRYFFRKVLSSLHIPTALQFVENGEELMNNLEKNSDHLPDILFLDINMPRKNGLVCIQEIRSNEVLKDLPVVIFSTAVPDHIGSLIYQNGAQQYIRKSDYNEMQGNVHKVLILLAQSKLCRQKKTRFVDHMAEG